MENLDVHIAVSHLKLCANDKEFRAKRKELKDTIKEYKQKVNVTITNSRLAVITHPDGTQEEVHINSEKQVQTQVKNDDETQKAVESIMDEKTSEQSLS